MFIIVLQFSVLCTVRTVCFVHDSSSTLGVEEDIPIAVFLSGCTESSRSSHDQLLMSFIAPM